MSSDSDYILEVKTLTGEIFKSSKGLNINDKKSSTFVQTDKATYKPSDLVQFRILMLDAETRPFTLPTNAKLEIFVTDGGDNRVKQFDGAHFSKAGVFQGQLQLSDSPVLGTWKLHVKVGGEEVAAKAFEVAEYVLPKFAVTIEADKDANFKDGKVRATVKATYTFGKVAKGNATVTAEVEAGYYGCVYQRTRSLQPVMKTVEVDGEKFVEFDMRDDLKITDQSQEVTVKLEAKYKDDLSGKEATASTKVVIHVTPHKIELKKSSEKFKPELPFDVTAVVTAHSRGAPVSDERNPVKFVVTSYYEILRRIKANPNEIVGGRRMRPNEDYECWEENFYVKEHKVFPVNGVAKLDIEIEKKIKYFHVKVSWGWV
jgi:CD109 antigen